MLRYQGFGYKKIADEVGLSRDSVRGYCVRNGLRGFATGLVNEHQKKMGEEFIFILCLNCGSKIEQNQTGPRKKYCSMNCKREWEKIHRKTHIFTCEYCGKEFKASGTNERKYCDHNCYTRDRFWRDKDAAFVAKKILEFKKANHLPKWLKDLLLSDAKE